MPGPRTQPPQSSSRSWRHPVAAGLVYSLAAYCSLPPLGLWPFTLIAALALIWGGCRIGASGDRRARGALLAGLGTLPLWFAQEVWLVNVTPVGYPLLALWLGAWTALTVYAIAVVRSTGWKVPMALAAPLVWVMVETLRGDIVLTGYPWYFAAHPLIEDPMLCLPARALGVSFVSALVVGLAGGLADSAGWAGVRARVGRLATVAVLLVWVATSLVGASASAERAAARDLRVGIVQTNIPQGMKQNWSPERQVQDFALFAEQTRAAANARPDLVLWPETMFPGWALSTEAIEAARRFSDSLGERPGSFMRAYGYGFAEALTRLQGELGVTMLVGSLAREGVSVRTGADGMKSLAEQRRYNSVAIIAGGCLLDERYDKVDLTPFGEVIPWVWRWPAVQRLVLEVGAGGMQFNLSFGARAGAIDVPLSEGGNVRAATPICFEVTRTALCRRLVYSAPDGRPADVMISLSNDGWFGSEDWWLVSSEAKRRQHELTARWRCLELGVPMVRAVNTGISGYIDARGRLLRRVTVAGDDRPSRTAAVFVGTVRAGADGTIYGRIGNVWGWASVGGGALLLAAAWRRRSV